MNSSEQNQTGENNKSGQEVAKKKSQKLAKTDARYWQAKLFKAQYTVDGERRETAEWCARIQHLGRRELFPLGTPNQSAAATKARDIYLSLQGGGWDATLSKFKPKAGGVQQPKAVVTVGEFLSEVRARASGKPKTIEGYARAFRTIVAQIFGLDGGKEKFDYRNGGREQWLSKIESINLADVTPERVQQWKIKFLGRASKNPIQQRSARTSCNTFIRQAKSLFSPEILRFVHLSLPSGTPFDGVTFEEQPSMRYRSNFSVEDIIQNAQKELPREQLKILLLASMAGLRRNEIDKLEWTAFRWTKGKLRLESTRFLELKSEDSVGEVDIDPELMEVFRGFHSHAKSTFVVESEVMPRLGRTYAHYRCQTHFEKLIAWLRKNGVAGNNPLHSLRKEYGSQVCAVYGIYAASHALRHADITITSQHYLDKKGRVTSGLGHLLLGGKKQSSPDLATQERETIEEGSQQ